jgi:hypothetical protein
MSACTVKRKTRSLVPKATLAVRPLLCSSASIDQRKMAMPKVDIGAAPVQRGKGYAAEFNISRAERLRRRIGDAGGLTGFGVNLTYLPPDDWSSQRH